MPIRRLNQESDSPRVDRMSRADLELEVKLLRQKVFTGTRQRDLERCQARVEKLEGMLRDSLVLLPHYTMDSVKEVLNDRS